MRMLYLPDSFSKWRWTSLRLISYLLNSSNLCFIAPTTTTTTTLSGTSSHVPEQKAVDLKHLNEAVDKATVALEDMQYQLKLAAIHEKTGEDDTSKVYTLGTGYQPSSTGKCSWVSLTLPYRHIYVEDRKDR